MTLPAFMSIGLTPDIIINCQRVMKSDPDRAIQCQSRQPDMEYSLQMPQLAEFFMSPHKKSIDVQDSPQNNMMQQSVEDSQMQAESTLLEDQKEEETANSRPLKGCKRKPIHKDSRKDRYSAPLVRQRSIIKRYHEESTSIQESFKEGKNPYPTKNFLAVAKGPHFSAIKEQLGENCLAQFPHILAIEKKNGISMEDYAQIYRVKEFEKALTKMFKNRVLYRELMISRTAERSKHVFMEKLFKFYMAFRTKKFISLN